VTCWKSFFRKVSFDDQLDSELRFHIEELTEANMAAGLTPDEARRQAMLEFGGKEQLKEELRDVYRVVSIAATFGGVSVLVLIVAAIASLVPALRAARVEPMQVLRDE
jgi:hypothetical protein